MGSLRFVDSVDSDCCQTLGNVWRCDSSLSLLSNSLRMGKTGEGIVDLSSEAVLTLQYVILHIDPCQHDQLTWEKLEAAAAIRTVLVGTKLLPRIAEHTPLPLD